MTTTDILALELVLIIVPILIAVLLMLLSEYVFRKAKRREDHKN